MVQFLTNSDLYFLKWGIRVKLLAGLLALVTAALIQVPSASANLIDVTYTGLVDVGPVGSNYIFTTSTTFSVTFRLNDATLDEDPNPKFGWYNAITNFSGSFSNGYSFSVAGPFYLAVSDENGTPIDYVALQTAGVTAPDVDGFPINNVGISFYGDGAMLSGDAIPDLENLLSLSNAGGLALIFGPSYDFAVNARIYTASAVAATPVPAALPLLISAIGGLGFLGWKRRRLA
jgi:hypothetical protein